MHKKYQLLSVPFLINSDTLEEGGTGKTTKQYDAGISYTGYYSFSSYGLSELHKSNKN